VSSASQRIPPGMVGWPDYIEQGLNQQRGRESKYWDIPWPEVTNMEGPSFGLQGKIMSGVIICPNGRGNPPLGVSKNGGLNW